jgi:hypothetical protein
LSWCAVRTALSRIRQLKSSIHAAIDLRRNENFTKEPCMRYEGHERRRWGGLTEDEIDHIAEKAAEKAFEKVYQHVGKSVLNKLAWMLGGAVVGLFILLGGSHFSK